MASEKKGLDDQLTKLKIDRDRKRARPKRSVGSWVILLIIAAGIGYGAYTHMTAPVVVKTVRVEQVAATSGKGPALVTASGYVVPRHKVEVSSKIIGRIKEVLVKRGDKVNEGDLLIQIDDADFQARVRSAEAQVAMLRARVAELKAGSRQQEIEAAHAGVTASEATLRNAEQDWKRMEALFQQGAVAKQELDKVRTAYDVAQARFNADRKNAELVKIGPRAEVIEAAEAQLREAEANLEYARTELGYTEIHAPISGTILEKLAEQGELVTNTNFGSTRGAKNSVVAMADLNDLQVEVDVNETDLAKIHLHQAAEIRLDACPDTLYTGEVDDISPQADRQKGTVQVKVRITNPDDSIKTEVNARVTFLGAATATDHAAPAKASLRIPKAAIIRTGGSDAVYVFSQGTAVLTPIKSGVESDKGIDVVEGLTGAELIILSPLDKLKPGVRVTDTP